MATANRKGNANLILASLKTDGPQTAQQLAQPLGLSAMGSRKHLLTLEAQGLVASFNLAGKQGRPSQLWKLTQAGHQQFPQRHAELTLNLVDSVREVFGEPGLEQLISKREQQMAQQYRQALASVSSLEQQINCLAQLRSNEGYMACVEASKPGWLLIEHHCPICAAATACQGFCRSELELFQQLFAGQAEISREQWLMAGSQRCVYRIVPLPAQQ